MQTIEYTDKSRSFLYEAGDMVRLIRPDKTASGHVIHAIGEYGKVTMVEQPGILARLTIRISGFSKPINSFYSHAIALAWEVEHYIGDEL